jgi:leucyl aminopeptidase
MKFTTSNKINQKSHLIVPIFKDQLDQKLVDIYLPNIKALGFEGNYGEQFCQVTSENKKVILLGLGEQDKANIEQALRKVIVQNSLLEGTIDVVLHHLSGEQIQEAIIGGILSNYQLNKNVELNQKPKSVAFVSTTKTVAKIFVKAEIMAQSIANVMDLVNQPSNIKTPMYLANHAQKIGKQYGYTTTIFKGDELIKKELHALYAVGKASDEKSAFIIMEYKPASGTKIKQKIGLVGKGVTFDTGGISLKPSSNMHYMKCDMAGGAAVIGMMELAARLQLPYHIVGIVAAAENIVNGNALKPGDIIKSYSGKTIEVIDTDAEGRLVLADGLAYMTKNYKPDILVDLATLTGSCVATLGYFAAGMFTNNDDLATLFYESGIQSKEKVWRLPMWDEYKPYMNSDMADIKNLSSVPVAGATTAAKFLELFTNDHSKYVHLDIAGVAFTDNDLYKSKVATGYGLKLLSKVIENL